MRIRLNGKDRDLDGPLTVAALLEELGLAGRSVAVAVNGTVVRRSEHAGRTIENGDDVEVIRAVAGG